MRLRVVDIFGLIEDVLIHTVTDKFIIIIIIIIINYNLTEFFNIWSLFPYKEVLDFVCLIVFFSIMYTCVE